MVFKRIKQSILLAAAYLNAGGVQAQGSETQPIVKESPPINNIEDSSSCTVHQGDHITLVACENGHELYETHELATRSKGLTNYGENRKATAVHRSLATGKDGHLTYLVNDITVVSAWWDAESGGVVKKTLLNLALESTSSS